MGKMQKKCINIKKQSLDDITEIFGFGKLSWFINYLIDRELNIISFICCQL